VHVVELVGGLDLAVAIFDSDISNKCAAMADGAPRNAMERVVPVPAEHHLLAEEGPNSTGGTLAGGGQGSVVVQRNVHGSASIEEMWNERTTCAREAVEDALGRVAAPHQQFVEANRTTRGEEQD